MPLIVKDMGGGKDFEKVPQGVHIAICNLIADVGTQTNKRYGKRQHKVYIRWEVVGTHVEWQDKEGGKHAGPMTIGNYYTASLSEKSLLRRDLENWRGRAFTATELEQFDLFNILGHACQIMVKHNVVGEKTYANITGVMGLPKGTPKPTAVNPLVKYSPTDAAQFEALPGWLREKILESMPAAKETVPASAGGDGRDFDDDIPF